MAVKIKDLTGRKEAEIKRTDLKPEDKVLYFTGKGPGRNHYRVSKLEAKVLEIRNTQAVI